MQQVCLIYSETFTIVMFITVISISQYLHRHGKEKCGVELI